MNMNSTTKQRCGEKLDQWGIHAQCCACGPGRNGRHNTFAWQLAEIAKDAGFTTTREVDVPQWAQWKTRKGEKVLERAILDVVCEGHLQLKERFLDMSVRCPLATTYMPAAAEASGVAAEEGARSKTERYPPTRGLEVVPCIMETYGRINVDFNEFLMQAATHAERKRSTAGLPAQRFRARWEADFSRLLARLNATSILSACRCSFAADTPDSSGSSGSQAATCASTDVALPPKRVRHFAPGAMPVDCSSQPVGAAAGPTRLRGVLCEGTPTLDAAPPDVGRQAFGHAEPAGNPTSAHSAAVGAPTQEV